MKSINFTAAMPIATRKSIHRWITVSTILIICTSILIIGIQINLHNHCQKEIAISHKLQQSKNQMLAFLQEKRMIKEQEKLLKKKRCKVTCAQEKQKRITSLLQALIGQENAPLIKQLTVKKNDLIVELQSNTMQNIFVYIKQLEQNKLFNHIALQAITSQTEYVQATVHATLR